MCGVEGAEYGFTRIFVWRGTIITGARFRCRTRARGSVWPRGRVCGRAALRYFRARPVPADAPVAAGAAENFLT
jgi:hypothetical protein